MSLNADEYFNHLSNYLDTHEFTRKQKPHYGMLCKAKEKGNIKSNEIVLADTDQASKDRLKVKLCYSDVAFSIRLDATDLPLFIFLDNTAKPWSKRCDFIIFHLFSESLFVYCIEFKKSRTYIPAEDVMLQLNAAEACFITLHRLILAYTNKSTKVFLSKFVFTDCKDPIPDLDEKGKYLKEYPDIRHYLLSEVDGHALEKLENNRKREIYN
ncbi:MAG: hypothetical protein HRT36_08310 [Alphaproteobacteria bacterium]|nr:hypothetical protein [Alphaproteobacteria bacterium]